MREVAIGSNDAGQRLDRFLRKLLPSATLGSLFKLLRTGKVKLNGRRARPDARLEPGDRVELHLPEERLGELATSRGRRSAPRSHSRAAVRVIHRDDDVLAVEKPPFLVVQPGARPEEPTLEDIVRELVGPVEGHTFTPSLAHRLDRGTSGVLLFGVSAAGLRGLTEAFREHRITKRYLALVEGRAPAPSFVVDEPLLRESAGPGQGARVRVSSRPDAQAAETEVDVVGVSADGRFTLVEARPLTGRTHQIRVHLRARGLPIVGDPVYGRPATNRTFRDGAGLWRPFLHAARVTFEHPVEASRTLDLSSPLPDDLLRALDFAGVPAPPEGRRR